MYPRNGILAVMAILAAGLLTSSCHKGVSAPPLSPGPPASKLWVRAIGDAVGETGWSVRETADGGTVVAGTRDSTDLGTGLDMMLIRTDADGNTRWVRTYGGPADDTAACVEPAADGGFILAGRTESFGSGSSDMYLVKTDADGNTQWSKTFGASGYDEAACVEPTADGGYILVGWTEYFSQYDLFLVKTDALGEGGWSQYYDPHAENDFGYCVRQTADGGYIVCGSTLNTDLMAYQEYLIKTGPDGVEDWSKEFGGAVGRHEARSVCPAPGGGYVLAGSVEYSPGSSDITLIRTDASGNSTWARAFGGGGDNRGYSVQNAPQGGYIVAGAVESIGTNPWDATLIRTGSNGNALWSRSFGGSGVEEAHDVRWTWDRGFIFAGSTRPSGWPAPDLFLVKTDASGNAP